LSEKLSWAEILERLDELEKKLNELKERKTEALI